MKTYTFKLKTLQARSFIHFNPVRAKIVKEQGAFLYSSAQNYLMGNSGCVLEIDLIEPYLSGTGFQYFSKNT